MSAFHSGLWRKSCISYSLVQLPTLVSTSVWCGWDLQKLLSRKRQPLELTHKDVLFPWVICNPSVLLCPCRVHQLAGEISIQLPSLEQRCMYLVAELIVLGHFTLTMRSTVTALKYLIQKQTPGWTPLQHQCSLKAGGAIQHVSEGLLREAGGSCLPLKGWRCGLARDAQSAFCGKLLPTRKPCTFPCS